MKRTPATPVTPETAIGWLREQLEALDRIRNSNTRDSEFKEWRQSTLTVIQRIWPGVTTRSRRFRRVPFRPPSTLADSWKTREAYERGCSEATLLLRAWVVEIEEQGVQVEVAEPQSESGLERNTGNVELPETRNTKPARPARGRATESPRKSKKSDVEQPRLKDMLGFGHLTAAAGGLDALKYVPDAVTPPPAPAPITAPAAQAAPVAHVAPDAQTSPAAPTVPAAVRSVPATPAAPTVPKVTIAEPLLIELVAPDVAAEDAFPSQASWVEPPILEARSSRPADLPGWPLAHETPPPSVAFELKKPGSMSETSSEMTSPDRLDIGDLEFTVVHETEPAPPAPAVPSDAAGVAQIVALASEVDRYDVPPEECDKVRSVLLDLAHSIGSGQHAWDALRAATVVVMHYPRLGRRAMPVLMPFLGRAA